MYLENPLGIELSLNPPLLHPDVLRALLVAASSEARVHDGGVQFDVVTVELPLHEIWGTLEELRVEAVGKPLQPACVWG